MTRASRIFHTAVLLVTVLVGCATAPAPGPVSSQEETGLGQMIARGGLVLSDLAKNQQDSAWRWSFRNRKEAAMCIPRGAYSYGVALNGRAFVLVLGFVPANIDSANNVNVWWDGSICGDSVPSWHSHIEDNGMRWKPSPCDMHQAARRPTVPFHLVAHDTAKMTAYMPDADFATTAVPWCNGAR